MEKTAHPLWETGIRYVAVNSRPGARSPARVRATADALASAFAVDTGRNRLTHRVRLRHPAIAIAGWRLGGGFLTSTSELAALAGRAGTQEIATGQLRPGGRAQPGLPGRVVPLPI